MEYISQLQSDIEKSFQAKDHDLKSESHAFARQCGAVTTEASHIGLNTIGMLTDRLSILVIKKYFSKDPSQHDATVEQIHDIESAMMSACKGSSSAFNKITNLRASNLPDNFTMAAMSLAATNLLLWLAQDVLYLRGADSLPNDELRAYITFFAEKNVLRNQLISIVDRLYWEN